MGKAKLIWFEEEIDSSEKDKFTRVKGVRGLEIAVFRSKDELDSLYNEVSKGINDNSEYLVVVDILVPKSRTSYLDKVRAGHNLIRKYFEKKNVLDRCIIHTNETWTEFSRTSPEFPKSQFYRKHHLSTLEFRDLVKEKLNLI